MQMTTPRTTDTKLACRPRVLAVPVLLSLLGLGAGCMTQNDMVRLPTLREVEPIGPAGKRCYDRCSHIQASCMHMCPEFGHLCHDDCEMDTKFCLNDCPELRRPTTEK
jgi:hypothetical protein